MWPDLSSPKLRPTVDALHIWAQVVGKVRMALTPWVNHSWHVPLYVGARGLETGWIPTAEGAIDMTFDLIDHVLRIDAHDGARASVPLAGQSAASFYVNVLAALGSVGVDLSIDETPSEIAGAIPFPQDRSVRAYDPTEAQAYWTALLQVQRVLHRFRTRFVGKHSPIHLFWGSFDLAATRFSGRDAPPHPGGAPHMPDAVARDGYFQELWSAGFWPGGGGGVEEPAFYAYAYPAPADYGQAPMSVDGAVYLEALGEFVLPYAAVRAAADPDQRLTDFLQDTYAAAADLAGWDRARLRTRPRTARKAAAQRLTLMQAYGGAPSAVARAQWS